MVWVNKEIYKGMIEQNEDNQKKIKELKKDIEEYKNDDPVKKAERANNLLNKLGVAPHTESGKQIRSALGLELLGAEYDMVDKYSKAAFVKTQGVDVMMDVRYMLEQEGILTKKKIEHKK